MTLRAALRYLARPEGPEPLPPAPTVAATAERLADRYPDRDLRPPPEVAAAAAARVVDRITASAPREIARADWREVVWHLWRGTPALVDHPIAFELYLKWLEKLARRTAWARLAQVWMAEFHSGRPHLDRIGALLADAPLIWSWRQRHQRYGVFDPVGGPERLAREVLKAPVPVIETLAAAGIAPWLLDGGFAEAAFAAALGLVRAIGPDATVQGRLLDKLMPWAFAAQDGSLALRYPVQRRLVLQALLMPWRQSLPPADLRARVLGLVAAIAREPRRFPQDWPEPEPVQVLGRLLAEDAIDRFCQVVEALGYENEWAYRRSFWGGYQQAGAVRDARLVVPGERAGPWQALVDSGRESVLLVDLGRVIAADFSHGGKLYLWRSSNPAAPALGQERYGLEQLTRHSDNRGLAHSRPDLGTWQREAAHWLAREAGIDLSQRDYMPSGWR
ncbi:MAG: hypothetical protein EAZ99_08850 [Alphaproteobacteria bacterium]|nr:MAG: hypothetical protein EAZ99_08850 [Alphaproteobacteria bacterium]